MAQRDTLPIPPPKQRSRNVDLELQQHLEEQREEEMAKNAQIYNQNEQQKKLSQKSSEDEEDDSATDDIASVRANSKKAVTNGRLALAFSNIGINLTTNFISLVTIIGPLVGILCFVVAAFFTLKTKWEINKIKKNHQNIPPARVTREIRKQILSAKNIIFTSCLGCASTAVAGILIMFIAFIPIILIYDLIRNVPASVGNAVASPIQATIDAQKQAVDAAKKAQAEQKAQEQSQQ